MRRLLLTLLVLVLLGAGCVQETAVPEERPVREQSAQNPTLPAVVDEVTPGCPLTPTLIKTKCNLTLPPGVELVSKYRIRRECEITAQTRTSASFLAASFKEVAPDTVRRLRETFTGDIAYTEVNGVGDAAILSKKNGRSDDDFYLYFRAGDKEGQLISGGDMVEIYEPATQDVIRFEGCSKEELQDIAASTLVPYLQD